MRKIVLLFFCGALSAAEVTPDDKVVMIGYIATQPTVDKEQPPVYEMIERVVPRPALLSELPARTHPDFKIITRQPAATESCIAHCLKRYRSGCLNMREEERDRCAGNLWTCLAAGLCASGLAAEGIICMLDQTYVTPSLIAGTWAITAASYGCGVLTGRILD
jgi:hypothetical protein